MGLKLAIKRNNIHKQNYLCVCMFYTKYPICQTVEVFQEMHVLLSKTGPLSIDSCLFKFGRVGGEVCQ